MELGSLPVGGYEFFLSEINTGRSVEVFSKVKS